MKRHTQCYVALVVSAISFSAISMDNVVSITTSDSKKITLPQWKIEASRLLHTKQELQKFNIRLKGGKEAPLLLKTICSKKLKLFSHALDTHDFSNYFNALTPEKKQVLLCAAGEQELDSPVITTQLIRTCFMPDFIQENVDPYFEEIIAVVHYLKRSLILDNCEHKRFVQVTEGYGDKSIRADELDGEYNVIPKLLIENATSRNYHAYTSSISVELSNLRWRLDKVKQKNDTEFYYITPTCPVTLSTTGGLYSNKRNLWLIDTRNHDAQIEKVIVHTNKIHKMVFSNNGNYLATSSEYPQSELILTDLKKQDDTKPFTDTFLTGHKWYIGALCFNSQSTILAVGSASGIQLWDTEKKSLLQNLDCLTDVQAVRHIAFNKHDNRFAACTVEDMEAEKNHILLWDTTDLLAIRLVKKFSIPLVNFIKFDDVENKLIITTYDNVLVVDGLSGEIIMETEKIPLNDFNWETCWVFETAAFIPHVNILATATLSNSAICFTKLCDTKLWDINSGKLITTLLQDARDMNGIGITPDDRSVISLFKQTRMTQTELYNNNAVSCWDWIVNKSDLLQKYLLLRLHRTHKQGDTIAICPDSCEDHILQSMPSELVNVKEMIEKYLLKK